MNMRQKLEHVWHVCYRQVLGDDSRPTRRWAEEAFEHRFLEEILVFVFALGFKLIVLGWYGLSWMMLFVFGYMLYDGRPIDAWFWGLFLPVAVVIWGVGTWIALARDWDEPSGPWASTRLATRVVALAAYGTSWAALLWFSAMLQNERRPIDLWFWGFVLPVAAIIWAVGTWIALSFHPWDF